MFKYAAILVGGLTCASLAICAGSQDVDVKVVSYQSMQYNSASKTTTLGGQVVVVIPAAVAPQVSAESSVVALAIGETMFRNLRIVLQSSELTAENATVTPGPDGVSEVRSERILIVQREQL